MKRIKGALSGSGSYSLTYTVPYWLHKFTHTHTMTDLSSSAEKRLSVFECYYALRDVAATCRIFNISRKTFYKWKKRYNRYNLSTLENHSRAPHKRRKTVLSTTEELQIKCLRKKYIRLGKRKLQILYGKQYHTYMSQHHIQYVIQKYALYYDPHQAKRIRSQRLKSKAHPKLRINTVNVQDYVSHDRPFFFATDTIVLYLPYGIKRYIVTAIELEKKLAYARVYKNKSSLSAFDFLMRLQMLVDGRIAGVLSDNGSEFALYFDEACKRLKITHIYTRLRTPKDNAVDERFNRTVQEEFMAIDEYFESSLALNDMQDANEHLTRWLIFYNFERPHQTLKYLSPIEWYNARYQLNGVLPMYPSITSY